MCICRCEKSLLLIGNLGLKWTKTPKCGKNVEKRASFKTEKRLYKFFKISDYYTVIFEKTHDTQKASEPELTL